jgi:starch phosphorylase
MALQDCMEKSLKQIFKDFFEIFPKRFKFITNGVTQRHWLWHCNALLAEFLIQKIGKRWLTDFKQIQELEPYVARKEVQHEFLEIKKKNKRRLIAFLKKNCPSFPLIDPDSLFDVQVKRFHEYKRQLMNVLNLILIYQDLKDSLDTHSVKRTAIFSGKAAAGYDIAKQIIHLIYCVARTVNGDTSLEDKLKIIFIENYSVSRAEMIIPAAELSEQISTAGMEASGTGNMKMAINGALTIGTEDGANIEMREKIGLEWWPFQFGLNAEKITHLRHSRSYNPWDVYATNPKIKQALDSIKNGFFAKNQLERESHSSLFNTLMFGHHDQMADPYFVLADLEEYYQTQHKVETLYRDPDRWAENALRNLLGMGSFSTDNAVENYAREIWGIEKCPIKPDILEQVKTEYTQQGRYRTIL